MNIELRELIMDDIPKVADVYVEAYAEGEWKEKWVREDAVQRICEIISSPYSKGGVCILNEKIVGCVLFEILTWHTGKRLEIKEIFVSSSFQGKGIGRKLLEFAEIVGEKVGASEIFLWTNRSEALINFYSRLGYQNDSNTIQFIKKWRY